MNAVSKGRHRRRAERVTVAGAVPVALAIVCAGVANSAPAQQPGVAVEDAPDLQPGVPVVESAPAPAPEPVEEPKEYWVAPPVEYDNVPTRTAPTSYYENDAPIAPAAVSQLHLPVAVEPVAPIEAPEERLRIGDYVADQPNWMSDTVLERTNNSAAVYEAQVNTFWRSTGVEASRADRIGAATIGGAAVGGLGTAAAVGIPAAVAGGLVGGYLGGNFGVGLAPAAGFLLPGVGHVGAPVIATAGGAAIGAAVAGVPAALVAGAVGAGVGAAHGMAFGAGDTLSEPIEMQLSQAPTVDEAAVTASTRGALEQIETIPGGQQVAGAVRAAAFWVPPQIAAAGEQARAAVVALPGGAEFVAGLDASGADAADIFEPQVQQSGAASGAVQAGLV